MTDRTINIRAFQHFMYCPRRFALLEINADWAENAFVVKANLMHEHVHDGTHGFSSKKLISKSAVAIYNDDYDIFGVADCIEFEPSADGVPISGYEGKYKIRIVEYKPKMRDSGEYNESDAIQVFAQKLCADYIWGCDSEGFIYYCENKSRIKLPFDAEREKYTDLITEYLAQMRDILNGSTIPLKRKGQVCSGCSIADVCFPKTPPYNIRSAVKSMEDDSV